MTSIGTVLKKERKWQKNSKLAIFSGFDSKNVYVDSSQSNLI